MARLPRRALDLVSAPDLSPIYAVEGPDCPGCDLCPPRLRPVQSAMLIEAEAAGGLFASVGVGWGKELASLLLPDAMGAKLAVLLVPPRLRDQLLRVDLPRYSRHFRIPRDRIKVVAYSELSSADRGGILLDLRPDVVVANEAHKLRNRGAAVTRKFERYFEEYPGTKLAVLSGSLATRSPRDYAHLARLALGEATPLPSLWREVEDWSRALGSDEEQPLPPGMILDLCGEEVRAEAEREAREEVAREGGLTVKQRQAEEARSAARRVFSVRLSETAGVVCTADASVPGISIVVEAWRPAKPQIVEEFLEQVRRTWRVDGDDLTDGKDLARVCRQIASGFLYAWRWPGGQPDEEWLEARSRWHLCCRNAIRYGGRRNEPIDSPLQASRAAERGDLNPETAEAWVRWKRLRDRYPGGGPPRETTWISDYFVKEAAKVAREEVGTILWYQSIALGEALAREGLPVYGAGTAGDRVSDARPDREPSIAVEVGPHSEGKNLQAYWRNVVAEVPANGGTWEQLLGRTHRPGQARDEVRCLVAQHEESLRDAFGQAVEDARGCQERERMPQRILLAQRIGFDGG